MTTKPHQVVQNGGLFWTVISRNERSITHDGRHFFAARCRPGRPWHLEEVDTPIGVGSGSKVLRTFAPKYQLHELSYAVRDICDARVAGLHPSVEGHATRQQLDDALAASPLHNGTPWPFPITTA